ncbi:MAG: acyl-[acyl-carrier-protein]--UDP-N-acetylglucosamine O-acyltransferase [Proteobacteria bacterium SG_bin7]|nr:MAG: acyl-[acyl-carrier-protein]--UDP-N-acetylglucosamine O-acyltransferase [Proteobacteria bacterium SG_bin7]
MSKIHPTAVISKEAVIDKDVEIGPFCVVRGQVTIGKGSVLHNHVTLGSDFGIVEVGENNQFFAGAAVGGPPQDLKYKNEKTKLTIGNGNMIREYVTVNLGTVTGTGLTTIANNNLIMAYSHIAHDCRIGSNIAIANSCQLAGHVTIEDNVRVGGMCGFVQFIKIGKFAYIAGDSTINKDVVPFCMAQGRWAVTRATNKIGLERAGFSDKSISQIHKAIRLTIMGDRTIDEALNAIESECEIDENVKYLIDFIKSSEKGIAR